MRTRLFLFLSTLLLQSIASAQTTDIYLFDIQNHYSFVEQIRGGNKYDNQPSFTTDSKSLLFTSDRAGEQTDIFKYDLATGVTINLTNSANENEYSGQAWGTDGFMYVLQEGVPYQNVWYRRWNGGAPERVLTSYIPAGYYARNKAGVLFWGRYSYALFFEPAGAKVGPGDGESLYLQGQAGTSIHAIPGGDKFSFVQKQDNWDWVIKSFDPATQAIVPLVSISNANENYCWTPAGVILTANATHLQKFVPQVDKDWQPLVDLAAPGFVKGGRCAVSPDGRYLALVNSR